MHETYYSGICKFYDYLKTLNCSDSNKILNSYAIIGGENSIANYNKKLEVKKLINTYFNCKCLLIDSNNIKLEDYLKLSKVQFIIITSLSALKLAENLKERYGINYFYFNSINYQSINKTLNNISTTLNIQFKKKGLLKINTNTFNQINNPKYLFMQMKIISIYLKTILNCSTIQMLHITQCMKVQIIKK